jgi:predicted AlkP superfamily phosphohydrolase/phosphomutase
MRKILIFGIDGGSWELINSLIQEKRLPNLKKLISNGVSTDLRSTIPPVTGPAWTSFATGKKPENHEVYDFVTHDVSDSRLMTTNDIKGKTFYELLSDNGFSTVLIGLPISYPPKKINGFILPDTFSPKKFIHPASAKQYLDDFPLAPVPGLRGLKQVDNLMKFTNKRIEVAKKIFKNESWDVFFFLFNASDSISHSHYVDMVNRTEVGKKAIEVFGTIDRSIGWFMENADEDTIFLLMSDHGFQICDVKFHLNSYLHQKGMLETKVISKDRIRSIPDARQKEKRKELFLNDNLYLIFKFKPLRQLAWQFKLALNKIMRGKFEIKTGYIPDIEKSKLYMPTQSSYCLVANDLDQHKIKEMAEQLRDLKDPGSGVKVFSEVFISNVKGSERIYFLPTDGYFINPGIEDDLFLSTKSNTHQRNGIFIASGQGIKEKGKMDVKNIFDIAPTILHILGIKPPVDMDGEAILDIFTDDFTPMKIDKEELMNRKERAKLKAGIKGIAFSKKI